MINFLTDKIVLIQYPPGAGGKFLINSLGLSNNAVFQDSGLAERQLRGNFSPNDKLEYLLHNINKTTKKWTDLLLGCSQLFGPAAMAYYGFKKNVNITSDAKNLLDHNKVIDELSHSEKYFFKVSHSINDLQLDLQFWPNAKVIDFSKYIPFYCTFRPELLSSNNFWNNWNKVKGDRWPKYPVSITEYLTLDNNIQHDIAQWFGEYAYFQNLRSQITYTWDTSSYLNYNDTKQEFLKLCEVLGINDIDFNNFKLYYNAWTNKLLELQEL